jgi:hypothetical protein
VNESPLDTGLQFEQIQVCVGAPVIENQPRSVFRDAAGVTLLRRPERASYLEPDRGGLRTVGHCLRWARTAPIALGIPLAYGVPVRIRLIARSSDDASDPPIQTSPSNTSDRSPASAPAAARAVP